MKYALQILVALLCNVSILTFGLQAGWLAPLQPALQSNGSSPLGVDAPALSDEEVSWIGALPSIVYVVTMPLFGYTLDKFGRKKSLLLATAPHVITYLLLIFANNVNYVYISRIVGAISSGGSFVVGPIYVSEIAHLSLKGTLGALTGFFIKLGVILSFVFGAYTSYLTLNLMSLSFTILFLIFYPFIPESPVYLLKIGKTNEAEAAYRRLWGKEEEHSIHATIETVEKSLVERILQENWSTKLKRLIADRKIRTGFIIVSSLFFCQMFSGYPAIVRYAVDIFLDTGGPISPYNAAIVLAVFQLIFSFFGAFLIERLGRKNLVVYALIIKIVCLITLAIYLFFNDSFKENTILSHLSFLPTLALTLHISCYAAAFGTVPFVIIPELFSPDTRAFASTVLNVWCSFLEFVVVKLFPTLKNIINLSGSIMIFSVFSIIGTVILSIYMFETRGLSFEMIQEKLRGVTESEKNGMESGNNLLKDKEVKGK